MAARFSAATERHPIAHDTLSDVIGRIDRTAFAQAFGAWVQAGLPELAGRQVAIDGKSLRGSRAADGMIHVISAFATDARLVLAAREIPDKANEITAIPDLLKQLNLAGAVLTIDAMGCQREIAKAIVDQRADYVLTLKENHPTLCLTENPSFSRVRRCSFFEQHRPIPKFQSSRVLFSNSPWRGRAFRRTPGERSR